MAQPTNCAVPTGGVFRPSAQLISMMMPNCTGSMPNCIAIGMKIGVQIRIVAAMSRKVPSTNSSTLIIRKMTQGALETDFISSPVFCGTSYSAMK